MDITRPARNVTISVYFTPYFSRRTIYREQNVVYFIVVTLKILSGD